MNALMNNGLVLCLMTAVGFGSWPMIARHAGTNNAWTGFLVMGGTAILSALFYRAELATVPAHKALALLALACVANGIGMIAYTRLVTGQQFTYQKLYSVTKISKGYQTCCLSMGGTR